MIRYRFGQDDLLHTRFAIAPLTELLAATYVLRRPGRSAVHRPWVTWATPRTAHLGLNLLDAAAPYDAPYWPVFVSPPPRLPHPVIEDELERVGATEPALVRSEIERAYPDGLPAAAQPFVDDPARALNELVGQMRAFWDAALAPWWSGISAVLESEIASRARRLASTGSQAAFTDLHPTVRWEEGTLHVSPSRKPPADVLLAGRGLLLIPSAFVWPLVWPRTDPPWDPALVYPAAAIGDLWARDRRRNDALEALLGRRRAAILSELDRPASTLELAQRMGVSAGGVSDHLTVLRRAGLVAHRREGRWVIYARTDKGETLCRP